jgi:uncharacterized membrane protein
MNGHGDHRGPIGTPGDHRHSRTATIRHRLPKERTMAETNNPYAAPAARVADRSTAAAGLIPGGRSVPAGNGWQWISSAWGLFRANPGAWILIALVYLVIMFGSSLVPVVGAIAATLLTPVLAAGIMAGCAAQTRGEALQVSHLFAGFQEKTGPLVMLGLLYLGGMVIVFVVAAVLVGASALQLATSGVADMQLLASMLLAALVGAALSIPLVMGVWFAPALILFHDLGPVQAFRMSFTGCLKNVLPFLLYGVALAGLFIVAAIPFFLGMLVLAPVVMASIYTGYRDIFEAAGD